MRIKNLIITAFLLISCLLLTSSAFSAVPHLVRYQGYLTDTQNSPLNGSYNLTFRIYSSVSTGGLLWNETQSGVQVTNGSFTVLLGQVTPLDLTFDSDCWISIEVNSDGEMAPRQRITSVPFAYRADSVGGIVANSTPQPNSLLPLDANSKIPNTVLYTGSGNGLDADTVDSIQGQDIVKTSADQSIAGVKTFTSIPVLPASDPATDNQVSRKAFVDGKFNISTGHTHDGTNSKKALQTNIDTTGGSNGQVFKANGIGGGFFVDDINTSNVIFQWSGMPYYENLGGGEVTGFAYSINLNPEDAEVKYAYIASKSNNWKTVLLGKFKKIAGITALTPIVYAGANGTADHIKIDVGGIAITDPISANPPRWFTLSNIDVSGLANGTIYDITIQLKKTENYYTKLLYIILITN
jgi:hypothetical protein